MSKEFRILILEDIDTDAELMTRELRKAGVPFLSSRVTTRSGFLTELQAFSPELVLADYRLPGFSGLEALELLKKASPEIPLIIVTGTLDEETAVECIKAGAADYVLKENLVRLPPAVLAALEKRELDAARQWAEQQLKQSNIRLEKANAELRRLVEVEPLTAVLNRRGLERALTIEIRRSRRSSSRFVILLADCDNFKAVNDNWGHAVGDIVLKEIASRMTNGLRTTDYIGRIGGDEFLILLPNTRPAEGKHVAAKLSALCSRPILIIGEPITLPVSMALVEPPQDSCSIEEILALGHLMLRDAKNSGKNQMQADQAPDLRERLISIFQAPDGLRVFYQPIMDLAEDQEVAHELLIRGQPGDPLEMPDQMFRACYRNDLLTLADLSCLKTCIATALSNSFSGRFHLNVFPSTLLSTPTEGLLELFGGNPIKDHFCLEISEQQFIGDPSTLQDAVQALGKAGVPISLDDVGFGKSSVEALILLEPQFVKIDRTWINGIAGDPPKIRPLLRLKRVAESLGATLIAEGIEKPEDLECLKEIGIQFGQGYYFGKPGPY